MKTINREELYQNLSDFLAAKGIALKDGSYPHRIRQGCHLLADAINATQKTVKQAQVEVDRKLNQLRQCIHEATAPKTAAPGPAAASRPTGGTAPGRGRKGPAGKGRSARPRGRPRK